LLTAETEPVSGEHDLLALVWAGRTDKERAPWKIESSVEGKLALRHPTLGGWQITHPELPALSPAT
jgi:hypothetical protein